MAHTDITEPLSGTTPAVANQGSLGADFAARRSAPFFFVFDSEGFDDPGRESTDALSLSPVVRPVSQSLHSSTTSSERK